MGSHPVHTPWGDLGSEIKLLLGYVDCVSGGLPKELQALPASSSYPENVQLYIMIHNYHFICTSWFVHIANPILNNISEDVRAKKQQHGSQSAAL